MTRSRFHPREQFTFLSTTSKIISILLVGLALSAVAIFSLYHFYSSLLTQRAQSFALGLDASEVNQLKNTALSDDQVPYQAIKAKLADLKDVYAETRFVYLMGKTDNGLSFLADSEPNSSSAYSPRNQPYTHATDANIALFDHGKAFVEGPITDTYGTWYSALSPVVAEDGTIVAVLGVDVPATRYAGLLLGIGLTPFFVAIAGSVAAYFYDKSRRRRLEAFRLQIELASIASHELVSPLNGLRWGEEQLLRSSLSEEQRKLVKVLYDNTLQLQASVSDILQLASLNDTPPEAPDAQLPIDIASIIQDIIASQKQSAEEKSVRFVTSESWPTAIPALGDESRFRRIFDSLTSSVIDYTKSNSLITFSYKSDQKKRRHIISYSANMQVKNDEIRKALRPSLERLSSADARTEAATVNLFLTQALIEQLNGKLWVEKNDDTVETFICLPFVTVTSQEKLSRDQPLGSEEQK